MERREFLDRITKAFHVHPVVAILGPTQCGKTTLARMYAKECNYPVSDENYFDCEDLFDLERLANPQTTLEPLKGLIVIDEVQRRPELFPTLRVLVDRPNSQQKFLILGSASKDLLQQSSESLSGRISYIELTPFSFAETHEIPKLWRRGGFPRPYLAQTEEDSMLWRKSYIQTFIEQDVPNLGFQISPQQLRRFWMMLTHYHGNVFNASEIGRSLNLSHKTIRNYIDILTSTLMVRQLQPWFENISKRQVKAPKIYFRDSGIFHTLLGAEDGISLQTHPKLGSSWEGFALEQVIRHEEVDPFDCYFWNTDAQAKLDLLILKKGKKLGFEIKYSDAPKITKSMSIAMEDLKLDELVLIYPGEKTHTFSEKIRAEGLSSYLKRQ